MNTKIDIKYKIPLTGRYNKMVYICPQCDAELRFGNEHGTIFDHIVGFSSAQIGEVAVVECPVCFAKWYFHHAIDAHTSYYDYFLDRIDEGKQLHFKSEK